MAVIDVGQQSSPLAQVLGVVGGVGQGLDALRQQQEQRDWQALHVLSQNPRYEFAPASPDEEQLSPLGQRLLGGSRYQNTGEGFPVLNVGGTPFTVRTRPPLDVEKYKLAVQQPQTARKTQQSVPDYGLGTDRNALMHEMFGAELAQSGQPPTQAHVAAVDTALAQRPIDADEKKRQLEAQIK